MLCSLSFYSPESGSILLCGRCVPILGSLRLAGLGTVEAGMEFQSDYFEYGGQNG